LTERPTGETPPPLPVPIIIVVGSRDPITLAQVAHLRQTQPLATYVAAPNGHAPGPLAPSDLMILQATPGATEVDPAEVSKALAHSLLRHLGPSPACLVLTGGETAAAVLAQMGVGLLEVVAELLPGVPMCRPLGLTSAPLIVTKSGGFGDAQTLSRLVDPNPLTARQPLEQA
jgi:D-threonate/D-erythronate kinase